MPNNQDSDWPKGHLLYIPANRGSQSLKLVFGEFLKAQCWSLAFGFLLWGFRRLENDGQQLPGRLDPPHSVPLSACFPSPHSCLPSPSSAGMWKLLRGHSRYSFEPCDSEQEEQASECSCSKGPFLLLESQFKAGRGSPHL